VKGDIVDTKTRLLAKSLTWQLSGLVSMAVIGYVFTGSVAAGGGIAVAGAVLGFLSYFLHEMAWSRITWGRAAGSVDQDLG